MPVKFWDDAFSTATYLINRLPTRVLDNATPLERLLGPKAKPNYSMLKSFGDMWDVENIFKNKIFGSSGN
jgi:hypothetical protein